ncbi:MAG: PilZ domain-containing protein [Myxococcales bacterium]
MEKRGQIRVRRRLAVRFGEQELTNRGFTRDISSGGVFVVCSQLPKVGTRIKLEIQTGGDHQVHAVGIVRRTHYVPLELRQREVMGFGLSFEGGRAVGLEPQDAPFVVELHFRTAAALRDAWQRDLRLGGLMVGTARSAGFDERLTVRLGLDFAGLTLELPAKVVQVVPGPPQMVAVAFENLQSVRDALGPYVAS